MKLVIGGAFQGKTQVAKDLMNEKMNKETIVDGATCEFNEIFTAPIVIHFHEYIKRLLQNELDVLDLPKNLKEKNTQYCACKQ
ncbi:hypothetical protein P261_00394 [Lachnospiraceae bacterium TWA4]|nr:hypothetical protein P261_00394 [Lachnospiraceae bacterium TWA4]